MGAHSIACHGFLSLSAVYVFDDAGANWYPVTLGSSGSYSNSHCTVYGSGSSYWASSTTMYLSLNISFTSAWAGTTLSFDEQVVDNSGASSGWWQIPGASFYVKPTSTNYPPARGTVQPLNGSAAAGANQVLYLTASDQNGYTDINQMDVVITPNGTSTNACFMVLFPQLSAIYVFDDNAVYWYEVGLNSNNSYSNSQCTVSGASSYSGVNSTLTLNLHITFLPGFVGTSYFDEYVADQGGLNSGWGQLVGATFTVTSGSLTITGPSSLPTGTVNVAYPATTLTATGGTGVYVNWAVTAGTLPAGLTLSTGGILSGTPSVSGTSNFTVQVTDSASATATKSFSLTISAPGPAIGFSPTALSFAAVQGAGTPASQMVFISNTGGGTLNWFAVWTGGTFLSLSGATWGTNSGTITALVNLGGLTAGTYSGNIQVSATGASNTPQNIPVTLTVSAQQTPLSITSTALPPASVGAPYSATLSATGGAPPYTWSLYSGTLPAGLALSAGGTLSGMPTTAGSSTFTAQVTDSNSARATQQFTVTVTTDTISTPTPSGPSTVLVGPTYTFTASGAVSSLGTPIQYLFYWGDGSNSGWVPVGTTSATHAWTTAGNYQVSLLAQSATDYAVSQASALQVSAQDFSLVGNYSYAPVSVGGTLSMPIATTCVNGFTGSTLTITSVSYGSGEQTMDAVFPPLFTNWYPQCGSSTTITIQLYSGALPGFYQVTVTAQGTAGGQSVLRSTTLAVTVTSSQAAGIVAMPYAQTVAPGGTVAFSVMLINTNNFGGALSLSCSSPSSLCALVSFSPSSLSTSTPSTMTVPTTASTPPGVYNITVTGTSPGENPVTTYVALTVGSTTGAPVTITGPSLSQTFQVDNVSYAGYTSFVPQPGGDTLTVTQTQPPVTGRGDHYLFTPSGGATTQAIEVPPPGQPGGNGCSWTCSSGSCGSIVPVGPPQTAPNIQNVVDASGDNPAVLYPGLPAQITINGSNFGAATGYLNFCQPGGSPCNFASNNGLSYQINSWSATQIGATVTLPTDAPTGGWLVYVSAMFWISGTDYLNPSMGNLQAFGPPTIQINSEGVPLQPNACAHITNDPRMPNLTFQLVPGAGAPAPSGNVGWDLYISWIHPDGLYDSPLDVKATLSANAVWTPTFPNIQGGQSTVAADWSSILLPISQNFCIDGIQPFTSTIKTYLQNDYSYWSLPKLVDQESSWLQFLRNQPYWGPPAPYGYGIMQLTIPAATPPQIWNWQANVDQGTAEFASNQASANSFWQTQVNAYNAAGQPVAAPANDPEGGYCVFSYTPDGSATHSFADAIALKRYNGVGNGQYLTFNTSTKVWVFSYLANNGTNYVAAVCSHPD